MNEQWLEKLAALLGPAGYEGFLAVDEDQKPVVAISGPEKMDSGLKLAVLSIIPSTYSTRFTQGMVPSTFMALNEVLGTNFRTDVVEGTRTVIIKAKNLTVEQLDGVNEVLARDKWPRAWEAWSDGRRVLAIDRKLAEEVGRNVTGRHAITDDDMLDLKIALGLATETEDVNDFIERVFA